MELEVIKLAAKRSCHADKLRECELLDAVADLGGQLIINGFEMTSESFALSLLGAENLLLGLFGSQEAKPMDARAGAVVPVIEGGNRDAKLLGDLLNGLALSPEFNELIHEFCVVHMFTFVLVFGFRIEEGVGQIPSYPIFFFEIRISYCKSTTYRAKISY